ncbi:hypothetical protein [Streptomyces sp. CBMA29]|uniref:hypothetical protein n=1 Tax=Streptomyces sp. CBMA29 TaxID=1896314 RepID=UPI001661DFCE|nr:hypothetical protein [Streptomyces sp. CBMA29]MBD0734061.1 hypothetical protein [Streptomyces sp. CBMA29]
MGSPVFPDGVKTVTLTGRYIHADGSAFTGWLDIVTPTLLTMPSAYTIVGGKIKVPLTPQGRFSVVLVATDNTNTNPVTWTYQVAERFQDVPIRSYSVALPYTPDPVDIAAIPHLLP